MKKMLIFWGLLAVIATLAGCKSPDYESTQYKKISKKVSQEIIID